MPAPGAPAATAGSAVSLMDGEGRVSTWAAGKEGKQTLTEVWGVPTALEPATNEWVGGTVADGKYLNIRVARCTYADEIRETMVW